jgi:hypothetical protein
MMRYSTGVGPKGQIQLRADNSKLPMARPAITIITRRRKTPQLQARVQIKLQLADLLLARSRQRYRSTHQSRPKPPL